MSKRERSQVAVCAKLCIYLKTDGPIFSLEMGPFHNFHITCTLQLPQKQLPHLQPPEYWYLNVFTVWTRRKENNRKKERKKARKLKKLSKEQTETQ